MSYVQKFYISDTHFGHEAVIGFCNRPFSTFNEMDEFMINAWNDVVRPQDIVYHLGDFCFMGEGHARTIFHRLNGKKILILGNHDVDRYGNVLPYLKSLDWYQPPQHSVLTNDGGYRVYLSHYAHRVWPASSKGSYHFYGHSHARLDSVDLSRDVGVDMPDVAFVPRTFEHLKATLPGLPGFSNIG